MKLEVSPTKNVGTDATTHRRREGGGRVLSEHDVRATILLVDNDLAVRDVFRRALEHAGSIVLTTVTGHSAIDLLRRNAIDLAIVDLNLPDMSGMEVIRRAAAEGRPHPFILMGACLTIHVSVEAMKLGAFDVVEKPVAIDRLLRMVGACVGEASGAERTAVSRREPIRSRSIDGPPGSAAHRWALHVVKACESEDDLKTLDDWGRYAGVSYSTLCESCRIVGIRPHIARDFTRALRAVIKAAAYECNPSVLLDVSDRRTLRKLLDAAGPSFRSGAVTPVIQFIKDQRFISTSNEGIRVLLGYFDQPRSEPVLQD